MYSKTKNKEASHLFVDRKACVPLISPATSLRVCSLYYKLLKHMVEKVTFQTQTSTGTTKTTSEHVQIHLKWLYTIVELPPGSFQLFGSGVLSDFCAHRRGQPSCCCHMSQTRLFAGRWGVVCVCGGWGGGGAAVVFTSPLEAKLFSIFKDERSCVLGRESQKFQQGTQWQ